MLVFTIIFLSSVTVMTVVGCTARYVDPEENVGNTFLRAQSRSVSWPQTQTGITHSTSLEVRFNMTPVSFTLTWKRCGLLPGHSEWFSCRVRFC